MRAALICAFLAVCINRQLVVSECSGFNNCDKNRNENASTASNNTFNDCCMPENKAENVNFGEAASNLIDWMRTMWNGRFTLKLNVLKNEENDTLVNIGFKNGESVADDNEVGRTFGIRRRMQLFLLLPISFKLGIIMTLLLVLTAMSLKTLVIGFVILLLLLHHTHGHAKLWGASKVHELPDPHKNIHIHVHALPEDHRPYVQSWHDPVSQPVVYSA